MSFSAPIPSERPSLPESDVAVERATAPGGRSDMAWWRRRLLAFLTRRQPSAAKQFRLPPDRVVEVEEQIEL